MSSNTLPHRRRPIFDGLHWAMERLFQAAGYTWELRRTGEASIGFWRLPLSSRPLRDVPHPRRLVLLSGFGDTPLSWLTTLALTRGALADRFDEVVLFDFPGFHGFLRRERCIGQMDQLLRLTLDALDSLKPSAILGHSLGGWLAGHYAVECGESRRPVSGGKSYEGPETLVLISPSGVFRDDADREAWGAKFEEGIRIGTPSFRRRIFLREPVLFKGMAREFDGFMEREDTIEFMRSVRRDHEIRDRLGAVRAKTWVIWGEHDALSPVDWPRTWLESLPSGLGQGVILPATGHMPQMERPARMALVLRQILKQAKISPIAPRWWKRVG